MASWSTVTVAKESPEHVRAFVAWHLGAGADEVLLYFDDPDSAVTDFDHLPQVRLVMCDEGFWVSQGGCPDSRSARQVHCATLGYQAARTDWIMHCDTDEFVFGEDISGLLDAAPASMNSAQILPLERLFLSNEVDQSYSDTFRAATKQKHPQWLPEIYNYPYQLIQGIRGHRNGKVFARTGLSDVIFRAHNIEIAGVLQNDPQVRVALAKLQLLHIYTFGFAHFQTKALWKFKRGQRMRKRDAAITEPTPNDQRRIEMALAVEAGDIEKMRDIYNDTFVFTSERLEKLEKYQEIHELNFTETLRARTSKFFP